MKISIPCMGSILYLMACMGRQEKIVVSSGAVTESVYASGTIKALNQYEVFSTVSGLVQEKFVTEEDSVLRDAPILRIAGLTTLINQQSALLDFKYRREMSVGASLKGLKIQIDFAKSKMENDALLFERQKNIWKSFSGTLNDLEQRELESKNSVAAYHSLLLKYEELRKQLKYNEDHRALEKLKLVGVDHLAKKRANLISGGEKQRVAIARAMINDPAIIMGDEPTGNLDSKNAQLVFKIFNELAESYKQTLLIVTHNQNFAENSGRIIEMDDGKIVS